MGVDTPTQRSRPHGPIVYPIAERPDVEVDVDGIWRYGLLRMWTRRDDGVWWAQVPWSRAPGENMLCTFPAAEVTPAPIGGRAS